MNLPNFTTHLTFKVEDHNVIFFSHIKLLKTIRIN